MNKDPQASAKTNVNESLSMDSASFLDEMASVMSVQRLSKRGIFRRLPIEQEELYFYILLHRLVLDRALVDLVSPKPDIRSDVLEWLDLENDNFIFACERALLEPEEVYKIFKAIEKIFKCKAKQKKKS